MDKDTPASKKFRILTLSLIASGALNIGLATSMIFSSLKEKERHFAVGAPIIRESAQEKSLQELLLPMSKLSFAELAAFLTNRETVEEGYQKRDLALGVLASFHFFHVEKALSFLPLQKREVAVGEKKVVLFPGINEEQYEAILRFAYQEKWPLTTEGLYHALRKRQGAVDPTLAQAFVLAPEFHALQVLFPQVEPATLVELVAAGKWELFQKFFEEQSVALDLSVEKRRTVLLSYLKEGSSTAAHLLLKTDPHFVSKKLEDGDLLALLNLCQEKTAEGEHLCQELLRSPRSDVIWSKALATLYQYAGEEVPAPLDLQAGKRRFLALEQASSPLPAKKAQATSHKEHIVAQGESLWKIAKHYKVKVDEIAQLNGLEKERIFPGMVLKIPQNQGTGSLPPG